MNSDNSHREDGIAPRQRAVLALYAGTVLVASAVLLALELTAARLIAPYVGVSIYTWTAIIGVILAGLSLGSWIGGVAADRGAGPRATGVVLALGALSCFAVLLLLTLVAPLVQRSELALPTAAFVLSFALFLAPAVLLGVVTPLLTTLSLGLGTRPGRVVGLMHAMAALGSIAGTFVTGFWLIQAFGTRTILVVCALVLLSLAAPFLLRGSRLALAAAVVAAAALAIAIDARQGFANPCRVESQYYCIRVEPADQDVPFGRARALVLDHLLHGINHESEPGMLVSPYVHLTDELILGYLGERALSARYLFVGGGAYTHPRALRTLAPQAGITVIEIDAAVTHAAREALWVDTDGMRIIHADARAALGRLEVERFDVVVGDVFHDIAAPYHLLTSEFAAQIRSSLAPGGLYLLNIVDRSPDPRLVRSVMMTLGEHFEHVHAWLEDVPGAPGRQTYIVSATDSFEPPERLTAQRGFERAWVRATERVMGASDDGALVLTDDLAPVERLISGLLLSDLGR